MVPRQRLDIGWNDLLAGMFYCFDPVGSSAASQRINECWRNSGNSIVSLSVRSGFDALLTVLDFPQGSEVLVSAITIRDMVRIIEAHGLVAVPVDLNIADLNVVETDLQQLLTSRTKAILVAHLFGSRMPLDGVVRIAHEHGLLVIEDCAQAFTGDEFRGHPQSDVACFSFGPIKTATALGGGVLRFRDEGLRRQVELVQSQWRMQPRASFLLRLIKYSLLKLVSTRILFTVLVGFCRALRVDHDQVLNRWVKGFAGGDFFTRIRRRPSVPLMLLMARRLRKFTPADVDRRQDRARSAISHFPSEVLIGARADGHSHWVFPIRVSQPEALMHWLWARGFDATRGASSMAVVSPPDCSRPAAHQANAVMSRILYLPIATCRNETEVRRLAASVREFIKDFSGERGA
jgi:perosamine synthetase